MGQLPGRIETVVIGAGQAGLTASALLRQAGREHVVLDRRDQAGGGWLDRWDAFRLVSPNWTASFPGHPYDGDDPNGFMPRDELIGRVAGFGAAIEAPLALGTPVARVGRGDRDRGFVVETSRGRIAADRVISATGGFQLPKVPEWAASLSPRVHQVHSHHYRNEGELPEGGVLLIGSGQSGVQIAEELQAAGRRVYLSVGRCGRAPRVYRGKDFFVWLDAVRRRGAAYGLRIPTLADFPDPRFRFNCNPHLSGHGGGHEVNLRRLAANGMTLVGRVEGFEGERVRLAGDLAEKLAFADAFFGRMLGRTFDAFIEATEPGTPPDDREPFAYEPPDRPELDLAAEGIGTVLWTSGYRMDWSWLDLPILDDLGVPRQDEGLSEVPGLGFIGLPWMRDQASATIFGIGADTERLIERLEAARA